MNTASGPVAVQPHLGLGYSCRTLFLASTALVLVVVGLGKVADLGYLASSAAHGVEVRDPVFPFLDAKITAMGAAMLELLCAAFIWRHRRSDRGWFALAYLVSLLLLYRLGLWVVGFEPGRGCRCLGAVAHWAGLHPASASHLADWLVAWWALGLCFWAGARVLRVRRVAPAIAAVAGAMAASGPTATAEHLELHGILTGVAYYENGKEDREGSGAPAGFTVWLSSNRWCVQIEGSLAFGAGSNTFYAVFANKEIPAAAGVFSGFYPAFSVPHVTIPWLAFCSGQYFREEPKWQHLPLLGRLALTDPEAHVCEAEVSFLDETSRLPRSVTFRTTEERLKNAGRSPYLRFGNLPPQEKFSRRVDYTWVYPAGMVRARYRVTSTTNLFGMILPLEAEYEGYMQRGFFGDRLSGEPTTNPPLCEIRQPERVPRVVLPTSSLTQTFLRTRTTLRLTNALLRSGEVPITLLPERASVVDHRLQSREWGVNYVLYRVRAHDQWKLAPDAELRNLFAAELKKARWARRMQLLTKASLYLAFAAVLVVPLGLMAWRMVKSNKQPKIQ